MVFLTRILSRNIERKVPRKYRQGLFIDSLRLHVRGGAGGNGLPKLGGVGGKGGDIYVEAKEGLSLRNVVKKYPTKRISGGIGENSHNRRLLGPVGMDQVIEVPIGVVVYDEFGRHIGELDSDGKRVLVAKGGVGGCVSTHFLGTRGQSQTIVLDLKLIADIGLVGFPNAGKSTLLSAISDARPKIASYPFTTLRPNVGVLTYPDHRQISMADLPGLIEGAHANIGLGHTFLKHVERTKLLLLVVDIDGFQLSPRHRHRSCLETVLLLNKEIELYREDLLCKPAVLAVNKMDAGGADRKFNQIFETLKYLKDVVYDFPEHMRPSRVFDFWNIYNISAKNDRSSVTRLKNELRHILDVLDEQSDGDRESQLLRTMIPQIVQRGPNVV